MAVKPLKINIKTPTPSAADRMYARHQEIRKAAGLPDPQEYQKKLDRDNNPDNPQAGKYSSGPSQSVRKNPSLASPRNEEVELIEMDKSAPQPGRDGNVSHKTYGSRDNYVLGQGKEHQGKAIKAKTAKNDSKKEPIDKVIAMSYEDALQYFTERKQMDEYTFLNLVLS